MKRKTVKSLISEMTYDFDLKKYGFDMMGYTFISPKELSFHHLIYTRKECNNDEILSKIIPLEGYVYWNGAILKQSTSHNYLHAIEKIDYEVFREITRYLFMQNQLGKLDIDILKKIRNILLEFESLYKEEANEKGLIIKPEYIQNRIKL